MPCQNCVLHSRREFLEQTLAFLGAGALAACSGQTLTTPNISPLTVKLSDFPVLASVGGIAVVDTNGADPIAVTRTGDTTFLALSLICPHQGVTVGVSSPGFLCPGHGARFAADGTWKGGQPTSNMGSYKIRYDQAAGTLQIG